MQSPSFVQSLSGRLLLLGVVPTVLLIAGIVTWTAVEGYRNVRKAEEQVLVADAGGAAAEMSTRNDRWNNVATILAQSQGIGLFGKRKETLGLLQQVADSSDLLDNAFMLQEPNADGGDAAALKNGELARESMDGNGRLLALWHSRGENSLLKKVAGIENQDVYLIPKSLWEKTGKAGPWISEPRTVDGEVVVSHAFPVIVGGKFVGVAGIDRTLAVLGQITNAIKQRSNADVFVISAGGRFLAATSEMGQGGSLLMKPVSDTPYAPLFAKWQKVTAGGTVDTFEEHDPVLGEDAMYAVERTSVGDWTIVTRRPVSEVMRDANKTVQRNAVMGVLGILLVSGLLLAVTRGVVSRVGSAAQAADRIARGDLTSPVGETRASDETGQLMRSMQMMDGNLNTLVGNVKQAGIRLNSTATEIAATSKQQEASSATFGAASNQIAAAVKEISATGQDLVRTMESVSRMAAESASLATSGRAGLQSMEGVMRDLDGATSSIADKLNAINDRSQKITTVITTITKVADQTNILSINAAIEAEKAGEYGSGFLVIAREIRRLADQTASATLDIEQMVRQMQTAVSAGVMEMDRFADQVRRGVRDVVSAGSQMTEIIDRVNRSTDSFKQVNESMQAQSEGAKQISEAMGSLVSNANQTVQSAKEFGRAAGDLQAAIALLRDAVAKFKLREQA
ncbi:MAG: HAMP domain-containing protein [Planctomycetes bacterium]|nr:HAMP domain-containing protein [Planctomycetota bacterium]